MKNLIKPAFILFLFLLTINMFAQESPVIKENDVSTFNLYFINGYALSYNFYNTNSFLLRAHLDFSFSGSDSDFDGKTIHQYPSSGEKRTFTGDGKTDIFNIAVSPQIIFPVYTTSFGQVYLGGGPFLGYGKRTYYSSQENINYYPDTTSTPTISKNTYSDKTTNIDLGLTFVFGLKAFVTNNISLFVESQFQGGRNWQENESSQEWIPYTGSFSKQIQNSDSDGWFYNAQFIRIGLSISL